jgi:hypothetical protein
MFITNLNPLAKIQKMSRSFSAPATYKPNGYWTQEDGANCRSFFLQFANEHGFDYKNTEEWYKVTKEKVIIAGVWSR